MKFSPRFRVVVVAAAVSAVSVPAAAQQRPGAGQTTTSSAPAAAPPPASSSASSSSSPPSGTTGLAGLRPVANPKVISLDDAFRMAAERSTDLRITQLKIDESRANVTKAWAALLPNVSVGANYTFNFPEQEASLGSADQFTQQALLFDSIANITEASAAQNPDPIAQRAAQEQAAQLRASAKSLRESEVPSFVILPAHVVDGNVTVALPLFNARNIPLLQNAYAAVDIGRLSARSAQAAVLWGVARTYYTLAATQQLVKTSAEQVESTRRHLQTTTNRHELGYETRLALERATLDVKKAELSHRQAQGGLRAAKAGLAALIGVVEDFEVATPPPVAAVNEGVPFDQLLTRAWDSRIDLRVQKQMLALADRNKTDAWLRFLPSFNVVAQGRYTSNTSGLTNQPFTGAVIVQGTLPIYDGGQTFGSISEANARVSQEILRTRQLEENIERELRGTLDDLALKQENASTTAELAELAKKTAQNAEALYSEGAVTQVELSDAQLAAFAADVEAQRAALDLETARIGLAYAIGELQSYIKADGFEAAAVSGDEEEKARAALDRVQN